MNDLDRKKALKIINELESRISKKECLTCECFQGLVTQLELDSSENIYDLTEHLKVTNEKMHRCLGCKPCPGGDLFAEYLRCKNDLQFCKEWKGNTEMNDKSENT